MLDSDASLRRGFPRSQRSGFMWTRLDRLGHGIQLLMINLSHFDEPALFFFFFRDFSCMTEMSLCLLFFLSNYSACLVFVMASRWIEWLDFLAFLLLLSTSQRSRRTTLHFDGTRFSCSTIAWKWG